MSLVKKVVSGGQTGADRAGLEAARELGIATGGFAPRGYRTENGPDPTLKQFGLTETETSGYSRRTELNVLNSSGTVWFGDPTSPGGRLTLNCARDLAKPFIINPMPADLKDFLRATKIRVLNVAGNRESTNPGIGARVKQILLEALA